MKISRKKTKIMFLSQGDKDGRGISVYWEELKNSEVFYLSREWGGAEWEIKSWNKQESETSGFF